MKVSGENAPTASLSFLAVIAIAVLAFSVTRGLVPLLTHNAALTQPTYNTATLFGIALSSYGLYVALFRTHPAIGRWPRRLLLLNLFLYIYWIIPVIILRPQFDVLVTIVYTGVLPFSIYGLIRIPEKALILVLGLLTLVISAFVIYDFVALNTLLIPDGYNQVYERQQLLRPDFEGFSRTGVLLRPSGLLGSMLPHDSGNMLAIFFTYWLAISLRPESHKLLSSLLTIIALVALLLTQSASNIVAGFVGALCVFAVYRRHALSFAGIIPIFILLIIASAVIFGIKHYDIDLDVLWGWSNRLDASGDWEGITNLRFSNSFADVFSIIFGHGQSLDLTRMKETEYAFVKTLIELGVVHSAILFSLLLYPVVDFYSSKPNECRRSAVPYVAGVFVGFLSLWHYGSVVRATNIFVFFALYAQALRILAYPQKSRRSSASCNTNRGNASNHETVRQ